MLVGLPPCGSELFRVQTSRSLGPDVGMASENDCNSPRLTVCPKKAMPCLLAIQVASITTVKEAGYIH